MIVTVTMNPAVDETLSVNTLQVGETNRITETNIDPGGKGLNTSRVIKRLGRPTVAIAFVGGETGEFIRNRLSKEGVETDLVDTGTPTRINISILDESTTAQTNLNHEGPSVNPSDLHALEHKIEEWLAEAVVVVLGGSLPPGTPTDTYSRLIHWMREEDIRTILDTSGEALAKGVEARPFMIKPNVREAEQLLGRKLPTEDDIISGAMQITRMGVEVVVISMGGRGAILASSQGVWRSVPPNVERGSTLGAGDSMVAGLAIGISEASPIAESLALGTAAGTATVMTPGTELCRPEDVKALLPGVGVEKIRDG